MIFVWRSCQWAPSGVCPREPESFTGLCPSSGEPDRLKGQSPEVCSGNTCRRRMQLCKRDPGKASIKVSPTTGVYSIFGAKDLCNSWGMPHPHVLAKTPSF